MARRERPLDGGDSELLRFAHDLRLLRAQAGGMTYRDMSARAGVSPAALSIAAGGRKLPTLQVTLAYVRACSGDAEAWEQRWKKVSAMMRDVDTNSNDDHSEVPSPYVGLATFQQTDADRFFGRDRLVERLIRRLGERHVVVVIGASGSGKSSLLRAGLLAAQDRQPQAMMLITPGARPLQEFAVRLADRLDLLPGELFEDFMNEPESLGRAVDRIIANCSIGQDFLLIVDQFEEIFTICRDTAERDAFVAAILSAVSTADGRMSLVLGLRSDFYGHCMRYPQLAEVMEDAQLLVGPMSTDELRDVVTKPAKAAGAMVENGLVARLIADATAQPGVLPMLSHVLLETWRRRRGSSLTLSGYEAAGAIHGAIAQTAESAYAALNQTQRTVAKQIFLRLTALGEGTEDTKRRVSSEELDVDQLDVAVVLDHLARARLITLDRDTVELAHETLIRGWHRLRGWLVEDREGLRVHRSLTEAADTWESLGRDAGALYRGIRLAAATSWARRNPRELSARERGFLEASRAAESDEQAAARRRTRRLRQLVGMLSVLLVVASVATVMAFRAESATARERNIAVSQKVAGQATALRTANPALSAQLSLAAYRLSPTEEARSATLSFFSEPYSAQLLGHGNSVNTAVLRPDGRVVATGSGDKTIRLWDVADPFHPHETATLTGHTDNVMAAAFSPDGRLLVTGGWDRTVRLWDVTDPRRTNSSAVLTGHTGHVLTVAVSPDGKRIATAGVDAVVRLWDVTDPRHPHGPVALSGHTGRITALAFTPDSRTIVTGSWDGTARLWDVTVQPKALSVVRVADKDVNAVAVGVQGRLLATAGSDQTVKLWDVHDLTAPAELATLTGHRSALRTIAFSPDSRQLASAGADRSVRLWNLEDPHRPTEIMTLNGHTNVITAVAFSQDGQTLLTASDDRTARLWALPGTLLATHQEGACRVRFSTAVAVTAGRDHKARLVDVSDPNRPKELAVLRGHSDAVCGAAISANRRVVTGSWDGTVRTWDITTPLKTGDPATISQHKDSVDAVAISPHGNVIAAASDRHTVTLFDLRDGRELAVLRSHTDDVHAVEFSPDGRTLATTSWDHTTRLWDISDPRRPSRLAILAGHTQAVVAVAFALDGQILATAGLDRTTRLWDLKNPGDPKEIANLVGHNDSVSSLAFGAGSTLATGGYDNTVRLWSLADPSRPAETAVLTGHTDRVYSVAFSPDGHTLASASSDRTVRLWETDIERTAVRICELAHPRITPAEWERYFPGMDYEAPCR